LVDFSGRTAQADAELSTRFGNIRRQNDDAICQLRRVRIWIRVIFHVEIMLIVYIIQQFLSDFYTIFDSINVTTQRTQRDNVNELCKLYCRQSLLIFGYN